MATATEYAGTGFAPSSSMSAARSLDTASSIYPERAIRPLPKSRLKSKLSPQQASTIVYPPDPPPISPTLNFSLPENAAPSQHRRLTNGDSHHDHHTHVVHDHCTCGEHDDSGDDEVEFDHPDYRYPPAPVANGISAKPVDSLQRRLIDAARSGKPPPPGSTASSADGYESFENTSNKKKRKIPLSGASSMHQSSLSAEMASMGISGSHTDGTQAGVVVNGVGDHEHYNGQAASAAAAPGTGISGAGRGRFGRQDGRNRRPLGSSTMNSINGYNSRASPRGSDVKNGNDTGIENTGGIISQAIKTAAEQGPLTPAGKGRDSVSLLQSAASATNSATTPKTQFTFTCESDSATKMVDQQTHPYAAGTPTPNRNAPPVGKTTHSTQTTPPLRGHHPNNAGRPPPPSNTASYAGHQQPQAPPPKPKPRRNPAKEYALQAANRKRNQQYQNFHHRPNPDEMWVCEFCEYEDIFGVPPYAMIRRYEIKDRQERKKAAEKRRLLEKAKMKGRKNKKGAGKGKNNNGNDAPAHAPPAHPQNYDPNLPPPEGDEDYYDDEYDQEGDEYDAVGDEHYDQGYYPPPVPAGTPATPVAGGGARPHV